MRHRRKGRKLGRNPNHQRALLRNLASALILTERDATDDDNAPKVKGRIITTLQKAKEVRPLVERCITIARRALPHQEAADALGPDTTATAKSGRPGGRASAGRSGTRRLPPWWPSAAACCDCLAQAGLPVSSATSPPLPHRPGRYTRVLRLAKRRLGDAGIRPTWNWSASAIASAAAPPKPRSRPNRPPPEAARGSGRPAAAEPARKANGPPAPPLASPPTARRFRFHPRTSAALPRHDPSSGELRHIDMGVVVVSFADARDAADCGQVRLADAAAFRRRHVLHHRRGRRWTLQRVYEGGRGMLYILNFYLPAVLDLRWRRSSPR